MEDLEFKCAQDSLDVLRIFQTTYSIGGSFSSQPGIIFDAGPAERAVLRRDDIKLLRKELKKWLKETKE